jgi:predicted RND superfamily exporter protein
MHTKKILIGIILLTLVMGFLSMNLKMTMRWSDLMPENHPHTKQFNHILEEFSSSTNIVLVIKGTPDDAKSYAEDIVLKIKELRNPLDNEKYAKRIDYKLETEFIKKHGLKLIKETDLVNTKALFTDPNLTPLLKNINDSFEKEYLHREESLSTREKEDNAYRFLDGIEFFIQTLDEQIKNGNMPEERIKKSADMLLFGDEYTLSYDKEALVVAVIPNFSLYETDKCILSIKAIQALIDQREKNYPDIKAGLAGMVALTHDEMIASEQSLGYTTLIALISIFIILAIVFRMWSAPILTLISLIIGITWAMGITAVTVGSLNAMTSMMLVILLGLGIDFSIHLIASFTEYRAAGKSIEESLKQTFDKTGKGIITGGTTTALAFLTLLISNSRGMKEMGYVTGMGLLIILLATFICLPIFLIIREKRKEKKLLKSSNQPKNTEDLSWKALGQIGQWLGKHYLFTVVTGIIVTILMFMLAKQITFDNNYRNLEPKGLVSIELDDYILEKFDLSMDYALMVTESLEETDEYENKFKEIPSVAIVDSIIRYVPPLKKQQKRLKHVREIRDILSKTTVNNSFTDNDLAEFKKEIERLGMNVMELQDLAYLGGQDKVDRKCSLIVGNPEETNPKNIIRDFLKSLEEINPVGHLETFQNTFSPYFKQLAYSMSSLENISLNDVPESILDRYMNKDRTEFLITIFPSESLMDLDFEDQFARELAPVSEKATGMAIIFEVLMDIIAEDGKKALVLTFIGVFILLIIDFRSIKDAIIAIIPLAAGTIWMVGLMKIFGLQFTIMNVMGLPMILGIGIDNGVHVVHRWRAEGRGSIFKVFASTGKAIFLTTATTMLSFGSLIFSIYRAYGSLGSAMVVGVASCFLTTIIFLSAIIGFADRKK